MPTRDISDPADSGHADRVRSADSSRLRVRVSFYSYFKDLTGSEECFVEVPDGACISGLLETVFDRFPRLREMERSTLVAVGLEYQPRDYVLKAGDELSLFPPVQGG